MKRLNNCRLFWVTIFIVSIVLCVKNVLEINEKRQTRPVMISFAKSLSPTFEIPFPAVTICPETKSRRDELDLSKALKSNASLTENDLTKLKALYQVCDFRDYANLSQILNQTHVESNVASTLEELANPMTDMFARCRYSSQKYSDCKKHFFKVITDEGVCYTFNLLDHSDMFNENIVDMAFRLPQNGKKSDWFLEKEYESMKLKVYPHRVIGSGLQAGLSVELTMNAADLNPGCKRGLQGFRLSLHSAVELPQMSKQFYSIPFQKQTTISVKPHMIYSSKDVKGYDPVSRQCFFNQEKNLKFFKTYTKSSCEMECQAEHTLSSCGCVKFSMPRDNQTTICDLSKLDCIYEAEKNFTTRELERKLLEKQLRRDLKHGKISKTDERFKQLKKMESCNCLPSCTHLRYDAEISQTDFSVDDDQE